MPLSAYASLSVPETTAGRRVAVADDDVLLREGIARLLSDAGYDVIGQAGDAATLTELVRAGSPDLAIVDIRMPPTHTWEGIDVARGIRAEFPSVGISFFRRTSSSRPPLT